MSTIPLNSSAAAAAAAAAETMPSQESSRAMSSYGQILKSTALVGGSQVINIVIGIFRTKAMAILLGPAGFGLAGLYMSVSQLAQSLAGMGVSSSGVRQIAEAAASGDDERIAGTVAVLRRMYWVLGTIGAAILLLFAAPIATITFGSNTNKTGVAILSLAVGLSLISSGQGALLQGTRRITDLAKMSVFSALFGSIVTIPIVYFFREDGVVPSLVAVAAVTLATSSWYCRRIQVKQVHVTALRLRTEVSGLINLGLAFMASSLMTMGSAYVIRIIISNKLGLAATGFYQAAWTLGGLYVGMILQAMGADFYPRLTAAAHNNEECTRLVNEQARVSMLLAAPGILATLTFAPIVISVFYAPQFKEAVGVLRWICLGIAMRVVSWPLGYVLIAKGQNRLFFLSDLCWTIAHLSLAWLSITRFGLEGTGFAFFVAYVIHTGLNYILASHLVQFRWCAENLGIAGLFIGSIALCLLACVTLPTPYSAIVGSILATVSAVYTIHQLRHLVGDGALPEFLQRGLSKVTRTAG